MSDLENIPELDEDDLKKATGAEYDTLEELREARKKIPFWTKLKLTFQGKTDVGKGIGVILDVAELVAPNWAVKTRDIIQSKTKPTSKPMLSKILSIKNFINLKDEQGNFSPTELAYSVIQIVLAGAIVYGAVELGIWNELSAFLNQ